MNESRATTEAMVLGRLYEAADDLGRLRRLLDPEPGSFTEWRVNVLAGHIETLIGVHEPTAAAIAACTYPGDNETVEAALELVDARHDRLRRTLGYRKYGKVA